MKLPGVVYSMKMRRRTVLIVGTLVLLTLVLSSLTIKVYALPTVGVLYDYQNIYSQDFKILDKYE